MKMLILKFLLIMTVFVALCGNVLAADIHDAILAQNVEQVGRLLALNRDLAGEIDAEGVAPLHIAAELNNVAILNLLLAAGAQVDEVTENKNQRTPLQIAVNNDSIDAVAFLVKNTKAVYRDVFLDARTGRGADALKSGELVKAYELLTKLLKEDPGNENVSFGHGLVCLSLGDFSLARMDFERVLMSSDKNVRARAELGYVHLAMGQYDLAKEYFKDVLSVNPSRDVKATIDQYLKEAKTLSGKWTFSGRIDAGYIDDSNVNIGPDSSIISIWPITLGAETIDALVINDSSMPISTGGSFFALAGSVEYDCGKAGAWTGIGAVSYYQNQLDDAPGNESIFGQVMMGIKKIDRRNLFLLPVQISHITTGTDPLLSMYGINPAHILVSGSSGAILWQTSFIAEYRDYKELNDRDGVYLLASETMKQSFGEGRHNIFMGVNFFHDNADLAAYENTGSTWIMGAEFNMAWGFSFYTRGRHVNSSYKQREVLAPYKRSDNQNRLTFGLSKKIAKNWDVNVNYQHTDNNSTFGLYQYTRNVTTINTSLKF